MRIALWSPDNLTTVSSYFVVAPSRCVLLSAVGLSEYKTQTEASFRATQLVCVERTLFDPLPRDFAEGGCGCDWVFTERQMAKESATESVAVDGCSWSLSYCNNNRIVGLPGTYRLRLNDASAIGEVQVYAESFAINQIPPQVSGLFFQ